MHIRVAIFIIAMNIITKLVILGSLLMIWLWVMIGRGRGMVRCRSRCIGRCWHIGRGSMVGRSRWGIWITAIGSCH